MATKKKAAKKTASAGAGGAVLESTVSELQKALVGVAKAFDAVEQITSKLPQLTPEERLSSLGRLRDKEPAAILALCGVMDAFPMHFVAIADQDQGEDDSVVETQPTRDNIARREALVPFVARAQEISERFSDAVLVLGDLARQVSVPAYRIATTAAQVDKKFRSALSPVTTHYGAGARKAQATLKRKKQASK